MILESCDQINHGNQSSSSTLNRQSQLLKVFSFADKKIPRPLPTLNSVNFLVHIMVTDFETPPLDQESTIFSCGRTWCLLLFFRQARGHCNRVQFSDLQLASSKPCQPAWAPAHSGDWSHVLHLETPLLDDNSWSIHPYSWYNSAVLLVSKLSVLPSQIRPCLTGINLYWSRLAVCFRFALYVLLTTLWDKVKDYEP